MTKKIHPKKATSWKAAQKTDLDMHILPEKVQVYLRNGEDPFSELEKVLCELGLKLTWQFKSPCG